MKIELVWMVSDPGPISEVEDICYQATPEDLQNVIIGAHTRGAHHAGLTLYTEKTEARADATQRLAKRDAEKAKLVSPLESVAKELEALAGKARKNEDRQRQSGMDTKAVQSSGRAEAFFEAARLARARDAAKERG